MSKCGQIREVTKLILSFRLLDQLDQSPSNRNAKFCLGLTRSMSGARSDCKFSRFKDQFTQITHWLDSSNVYGSDKERSDMLRTFRNGSFFNVI